MLHRAARNAYSWWWASHIRTKQSKWLEDNLQDMEEKVVHILEIIDEDGDTFAQRAEMYYRKRPELVNYVEDCFRRYRALAERYDHLSTELQSANRAIGSVYPDRVHLPMDDDEDGEKFGMAEKSSDRFIYLSNNSPVAPNLNIPKVQSPSRSNAKAPSRLMSRKGLLKSNATGSTAATPKSGLSKSKALKEIDRLQKGILAFQTEKEFVKSSYEIGLAKYWEIENQVTEMQAKVSSLQDEFGIGTWIDDDEAQKLMISVALDSCQHTLARVQEKQKQSAKKARAEYDRIQQVQDKFKILKEEFISNSAHEHDLIKEQKPSSLKLKSKNLEKQVETEKENFDLELLHAKIKKELQGSSSSSLTMFELIDKVDELVDKVIKMEWELSSQNAQVKRLRSETNKLWAHLQTLQDEKESLIKNADVKNVKIRELEEELCRVQSLMECIKDQSNNLQIHFAATSCNLDDLSEKLQKTKVDKEVESTTLLGEMTDAPVAKPVKQFQVVENTSVDNILETCKDINARETKEKAMSAEKVPSCSVENPKGLMETRCNKQLADIPRYQQEKAVSRATSDVELLKEKMIMALSSGVSGEDVKESNEVKKGSTSGNNKVKDIHNEQPHCRKYHLDFQGSAAASTNSGNVSKENEDSFSPGYHATEGIRRGNEANKHSVLDNKSFARAEENNHQQDTEKCNESNFFQAHHLDFQGSAAASTNSGNVSKENVDSLSPGYHATEGIRRGNEANKQGVLDNKSFARAEENKHLQDTGKGNESNFFQAHHSDFQGSAAASTNSGNVSKENVDSLFPGYHATEGIRRRNEANKHGVLDNKSLARAEENKHLQDTEKGNESNFFQAQERATLHATLKDELNESDVMVCNASPKYEERNMVSCNQGNHLDEALPNCPFGASVLERSGEQFKEICEMIDPAHESFKYMTLQMKKESFVQSNPKRPADDYSFERQDIAPKTYVKHEDLMIGDNEWIISTHMDLEGDKKGDKGYAEEDLSGSNQIKNSDDLLRLMFLKNDLKIEKEKEGPEIARCYSGQSDLCRQFVNLSENIHVKGVTAPDLGKKSEVNPGVMAIHDISTISRDAVKQEAGKDQSNFHESRLYNHYDDKAGNLKVNDCEAEAGAEKREAFHYNSTILRDTTPEDLWRDHKSNGNFIQFNLHKQPNDLPGNAQIKDIPTTGFKVESQADEGKIALHDITTISGDTSTKEDLREDHKSKGKMGQFGLYSQFLEPPGGDQVKQIAGNFPAKQFEEHNDLMGPLDMSTVLRNVATNDRLSTDCNVVNSELPNFSNQSDEVIRNVERNDVATICHGKRFAALDGITTSSGISNLPTKIKTEEELNVSGKASGNSKSERSYLHNQFDDISRNIQVKDVAATDPEKGLNAHEDVAAGRDNPSDMAIEEEFGKGDQASSVLQQFSFYHLINDASGNIKVKDTADGRIGLEAHKGITAPQDISTISRDMATDKEQKRDGKATGNLGQSDLYNQLNDASVHVKVNESAKHDEGKHVEPKEDVIALHNISTLSRNTAAMDSRGEGKIDGNFRQSVWYNTFDNVARNVQENDVAGIATISTTTEMDEELKRDNTLDQGKFQEAEIQDSSKKVHGDPYLEQAKSAVEENDQPNWKELFLNGSDDKEKQFRTHEGILTLHGISTFSEDTATVEKMKREGKNSRNSGQFEGYNTFDKVSRNVQENDVAGIATISRHTEMDEELKRDNSLDQGKFQEAKIQDSFRNVRSDPYPEQAKSTVEENDQPNWKELFLNGLDDREKILLQEYTSILQNYKEAKKKLNEVEKTKRASLFQYAIQIKILRSANAAKDSEIHSLQKKLKFCQTEQSGSPDSSKSLIMNSFNNSDAQATDSHNKAIPNSLGILEEPTAPQHAKISYIEADGGHIEITNVDQPHTFSTIEEKIRMDIDGLLEENIELWLRFSTSFHQLQKFQNTVQDLQAELVKVNEEKQQDEDTNASLLSEIRPIYRHMREIQTELTLWLEHNAVLKDDLQNRLSSLSDLQEEITRLSNAGPEMVEECELSSYQAAKFQGEVLNMKQESNKVAEELQAGLERAKRLQDDIQKTLANLDEELGISSRNQQPKNRNRIPLRTFLFGAKLKKQRPSIFACMTPALQKQYSDIQAIPT